MAGSDVIHAGPALGGDDDRTEPTAVVGGDGHRHLGVDGVEHHLDRLARAPTSPIHGDRLPDRPRARVEPQGRRDLEGGLVGQLALDVAELAAAHRIGPARAVRHPDRCREARRAVPGGAVGGQDHGVGPVEAQAQHGVALPAHPADGHHLPDRPGGGIDASDGRTVNGSVAATGWSPSQRWHTRTG